MKKHLLLLFIFSSITILVKAQNLNVTLAGTLTYSTGNIANICGWKSPVDGKEYALVGAQNGLSIVNVTNPATPTQVVLIPGPVSNWREIKTNGNYAYVTSEGGAYGLQVVNLTNLPATNLATATWTPTIGGTKMNTVHALHIDNGKVYLYGSKVGNGGAIIADIATNPMAPVYLGSWDNRYIHDGYVRGDTLYACHIYQGDCEVVDLKNPAAGVSIGDFDTPNKFSHNSWLSKNSKICFTTDEVNNSFLASYDVSNLGNIPMLDKIQSNPGSNSVVHNTHIINVGGNDYAVTSWYNDGITIVDAGRPDNLVQVGNYDTAPTSSGAGMGHCWGVYPYLPSGILVASDESNGLFVLSPTYKRASYLEGVVKDCSTGKNLAGVQVQITNPGPSINSATDITDVLGKYGVGVLNAGTYTVTFSKQAYVSQTYTVSLTSGSVTPLNISLCSVSPSFSYTGHVYDNMTSANIAGANVHFQDNTLIWDTITDVNGNFTIPNMLGGTYDLIVGKWGHITKCFSNQNINSTSTPLNIGLDAGIYDDFSFDWGWTISGACNNVWERGIPIGTNDGGAVANPDKDDQSDCSNQAFVTDNGGGSATDHDVDPPGYAILTSPVFDPTLYPDPFVSYSRWFYDAMLSGNQPNDTMNIYIDNGTNTALLERITKNTAANGTWVKKKYKISSYVPLSATMQVIISTSDAGPGGTIVEGGFDKFYVYDSTVVSVNTPLLQNESVSMYPNPFHSEAILSVNPSLLNQGALEMKIIDVYGREVRSIKIQSSEYKFKRNELAEGIYMYKIVSSNNIVASEKFIIE